jgi:hypothetical protein
VLKKESICIVEVVWYKYNRVEVDDDEVVVDEEAWSKIMKKSWLIHFSLCSSHKRKRTREIVFVDHRSLLIES